ncbi:class E sortase [Corynebacterium pelargi]|uniref:Sortase family protein n=1 Tax=Corynebacterium pelargi TaxID=1471400 RepID=A0A410W666_9CORY|nr:class E sortase [Corynebacterium pelargi]QAU51440.1 Sortase family protein [Corynebacterium pelargi]GGG79175.1 class E sortase [Corynebacterium pelargi]
MNKFSQVCGEILATVGVLLLLFAFYEAYWTNIAAGRAQDEVSAEMQQRWQNPRSHKNLELGDAFANMYIPAFGSDFAFAVVEGANDEALLAGPGHYPETQMPGERGNFAIAGHRVGKGAPFNDLGNLNSCDAIVIETRDSWDVYRVLPMGTDPATRNQEAAACLHQEQLGRVAEGDYAGVQGRIITTPGDVGVIDPLPNVVDANIDELEPIITLTTCHPQFSNAERMIIHGMLTESLPKDGPRPAVMEA